MSEVVYRAWSPSRGTVGDRVFADRGDAMGAVSALNQGAATLGLEPDWVIQYSPVAWEAES